MTSYGARIVVGTGLTLIILGVVTGMLFAQGATYLASITGVCFLVMAGLFGLALWLVLRAGRKAGK